MACGQPKNLEIAARNPLCRPGDRRRNFLTTRDGNRRRGNPEPPGKGQLRAFGQGEVRRHRQGGNPEPPVRGKPRATRCWADSGASGLGESPVPPGKRETRKGEPRATGAGKTSRCVAEGQPRVRCGEESSGPSAKRKLQIVWRRGNPELRNEKKALSHRRRENLSLLAWGKPRSFGERKLGATAREILGATRLGGNPGSLAKRKA
jgi:hypothetical protein